MKNPEMMMYRVAIGQILADAGINRTTIQEMVKESINEKIDREFPRAIEKALASISTYEFRTILRDEIQKTVKEELRNIKISVQVIDARKDEG